jgi:thymidylate kinase
MAEKGRIFALVGADGSGKSTLTKALGEWLSWKLAVMTSYFGIPKTVSVWLVVHVAYFFRMVGKLNPFKTLRHKLDSLAKEASARRWLFIAKKRLSVYTASLHFASVGGIVIADRYPLPAFQAMEEPMDGPRIKAGAGGQTNRLSDREEDYYSRIRLPDKIFVLQTGLDKLRERKGNVERKIHEAKAKAVNALEYSDIIDVIDGNRPCSDVLLDVKRRIWESL